jgi:hypothetical protein
MLLISEDNVTEASVYFFQNPDFSYGIICYLTLTKEIECDYNYTLCNI